MKSMLTAVVTVLASSPAMAQYTTNITPNGYGGYTVQQQGPIQQLPPGYGRDPYATVHGAMPNIQTYTVTPNGYGGYTIYEPPPLTTYRGYGGYGR